MVDAKKNVKEVMGFEYDLNTAALGIGSYGQVYKGRDTKTNEVVAIKVIPKSKFQEFPVVLDCLMKEINTMSTITIEQFLKFINAFRTANNLYLVTEFCEGGSLESKLKIAYGRTLLEADALSIIKQIVQGFVDLEKTTLVDSSGQSLLVVHRDIKPANILFKDNKVKIADFGFATFVNRREETGMKVGMGTPQYMSPQILEAKPYGPKTDIWSTGVMLYEMLYGSHPWEASTRPELLAKILKEPLTFPKDVAVSAKTIELLKKMLSVDESKRFGWQEAYNHLMTENKDNKPKIQFKKN